MREEQFSAGFEKISPPEAVEAEEVSELHEQNECPDCGNIIESDSPGCDVCKKIKAKPGTGKK